MYKLSDVSALIIRTHERMEYLLNLRNDPDHKTDCASELEIEALHSYLSKLNSVKCDIYRQRGAKQLLENYNNGLITLDELVEAMVAIVFAAD